MIKPKIGVHLIAETKLNKQETIKAIFNITGTTIDLDSRTDAEELMKVAIKICNLTFDTETNKNITKIHETTEGCVLNVIKQGHDSILEHATATFLITGISRSCAAQLGRHRFLSISETSLRGVRYVESRISHYQVFNNFSKKDITFFDKIFAKIEDLSLQVDNYLQIDKLKLFKDKKYLTSFLKLFLPLGTATNMVITANLREFRHIIKVRTSEHADQEIRFVCKKIEKLLKKHKLIFGDK